MRLFLDHAGRRVPGWGQEANEVAGAARLCGLLDGLPLGIELAAHWIDHYSTDEIADALQSDLDSLAARTRDIPDRHRSLRAVFEHSWRLLSEEETGVDAAGGLSRQLRSRRRTGSRSHTRRSAGPSGGQVAPEPERNRALRAPRAVASVRCRAVGERVGGGGAARAACALLHMTLAEQSADDLYGQGRRLAPPP
ncbi:MAG: hypothetical protein M9890_13240 [Thermomicrobiales bacterium]|nr:hypothetical protein [Thermomicrobiales bacterium]